ETARPSDWLGRTCRSCVRRRADRVETPRHPFARPRWLIPHHLRATSPVSRRGVDDADTEERAMTDTAGEAAEALRGRMTGPVITPDDRSYDDARRLWNGDADGRPAVIACCMSRDDVAAAGDVAQALALGL